MAKTIEVIADLTLELDGDKVRVTNDADGDLVILFPDKRTLGKFMKTRLALDQGFNSLNRVNKLLKEQQQPVILRVNNEEWDHLGSLRQSGSQVQQGSSAVAQQYLF